MPLRRLPVSLAVALVGSASATVSPHGQMPDASVPTTSAPTYEDDAYEDTYGTFALDGCVPGCAAAWIGDGECDEACNVRECNFDGEDCYSGFGECYTANDGSDYRGQVSHTKSGVQCQVWSHQSPHSHQKTHVAYPNAGLGGHNHCRNPDHDVMPWCLTVAEEPVWEYCDVGPKSTKACTKSLPAVPQPNATASPSRDHDAQ